MMEAKKSLGQNFLVDKHYTDLIAGECVNGSKNLVEIGCGTGTLTEAILSKLDLDSNLHGLEIDKRSLIYLNQIKYYWRNFTFELNDATKMDYSKFGAEKMTVVGNLPYNSGTNILLNCVQAEVPRMVFLLQKEVVDRVTAKVGTSEYSGLTVLVQSFYNVKSKLLVPPNCFKPQPKVYSKLLICDLLPNQGISYTNLSSLLRAAFGNRRKMLRNCLGNSYPNLLEHIDPTLRPQDLAPREYCNLTKYIT